MYVGRLSGRTTVKFLGFYEICQRANSSLWTTIQPTLAGKHAVKMAGFYNNVTRTLRDQNFSLIFQIRGTDLSVLLHFCWRYSLLRRYRNPSTIKKENSFGSWGTEVIMLVTQYAIAKEKATFRNTNH